MSWCKAFLGQFSDMVDIRKDALVQIFRVGISQCEVVFIKQHAIASVELGREGWRSHDFIQQCDGPKCEINLETTTKLDHMDAQVNAEDGVRLDWIPIDNKDFA